MTTPTVEAFDEALTALWDEIDLHTSLDNFKSAVKQLVDTHIIGEDFNLDNMRSWEDGQRKRGANDTKKEQRHTLTQPPKGGAVV